MANSLSKSTLAETDHSPAKLPSERSFGILFTIVFLGLATYWTYRGRSGGLILTAAVAGAILAVVTMSAPKLLAPLNRAWFRLGQILGKVVSPIVLGIIYFGVLTPVAVIARMLGRDELKLKRRNVPSYWVERNPPGPVGDTFKNQF